mmetsp:Transcript_38482/g.107236  ORF Transcript_38482/g.107236 Transcript_38482/m.107236 type:complete len:80 (+) Transcript_38482:797-1036(+)
MSAGMPSPAMDTIVNAAVVKNSHAPSGPQEQPHLAYRHGEQETPRRICHRQPMAAQSQLPTQEKARVAIEPPTTLRVWR